MLAAVDRGQHWHSDCSELWLRTPYYHWKQLFCEIGPDGLAVTPHAHQYHLCAHDPVAGWPVVPSWTTDGRYYPLHTRTCCFGNAPTQSPSHHNLAILQFIQIHPLFLLELWNLTVHWLPNISYPLACSSVTAHSTIFTLPVSVFNVISHRFKYKSTDTHICKLFIT